MTDQQRHGRAHRRRAGLGSTYLVECFASTGRDLDGADQRSRALVEALAGSPHRIEFVVALVLPDDEQVLLVLRGADVGSVRAACLEAGLTVDRVAAVAIRDGAWPASGRAGGPAVPRAAGCRP